jgi:hypothetical protein
MQKLKNLFLKIVSTRNPFMLYGLSLLIIGTTGIIFSFVSFIGAIKIIKSLLKGKSYVGNQPYLAALVITTIICISLLIWGFKSFSTGLLNVIRDSYPVPGPPEFEDYEEVENALVRKQIPMYKTGPSVVAGKDRYFIKKFLFFLGLVILFLIGKRSLPDELFWDYNLTPGDFSFPLFFIVILAAAAALRAASIYFHTLDQDPGQQVSEVIKSIKGGGNPYTFEPGIENALLPLRQNGNPNFVFRSGFSQTQGGVKNTGKVEKKMFIETHPKSIPNEPHPIMYLYLFSAILLFIIGILFITKLPPDNISVLTVPTIAIGYLWTIIKGSVLVFIGRGLMESFSTISSTYRFESVMVYVEVEGVYGKAPENSGRAAADSAVARSIIVRSDCLFKVYTTKLTTEIYTLKGKRHIIKMTVESDSIKAKELVVGAIERFEKEGVSIQGLETSSAPKVEDIAELNLLDILEPADDESTGEN